MPAVMGISISPDRVGEAPCAIWRKIGRKVMAPNIAAPAMNPMMLVTQKTFIRKSPSGSMGSSARRSMRRKAMPATTASAARPRVWAESQA